MTCDQCGRTTSTAGGGLLRGVPGSKRWCPDCLGTFADEKRRCQEMQDRARCEAAGWKRWEFKAEARTSCYTDAGGCGVAGHGIFWTGTTEKIKGVPTYFCTPCLLAHLDAQETEAKPEPKPGYDETLFHEAGWEWAELGEATIRVWCDTDGPHCINGTGAWQQIHGVKFDKFLCARCLDHLLTPESRPWCDSERKTCGCIMQGAHDVCRDSDARPLGNPQIAAKPVGRVVSVVDATHVVVKLGGDLTEVEIELLQIGDDAALRKVQSTKPPGRHPREGKGWDDRFTL